MIYNTKVTSKGQVTIPVEIMVNCSMDAFREAQRAFAGGTHWGQALEN